MKSKDIFSHFGTSEIKKGGILFVTKEQQPQPLITWVNKALRLHP